MATFDAATADIPEELRTPEFVAAWYEWCDYRRETGKKITERACKAQLKKLAKYGSAVAVIAIEKAIASDWTGVFPESVKPNELRRVGVVQHQYDGLRTWAARHKDDLHREYGT